MELVDPYAIIISTLSLLFSLLIYFGMHPPRRIQSLVVSFVRFTQLQPAITIMVFLILISGNLLTFKALYFSRILTGIIGAITGLLIVLLIDFGMRVTIRKKAPSINTQFLAVMASRFHHLTDFTHETKIGTPTYGPPLHWMQTALDTYGISFVPVIVAQNELFELLKSGVIDAVLVTKHASAPLDEPIAIGEVLLLPWSTEAIEAVTKSFPTATRPAVLPSYTYVGQSKEIKGYAPH